MLYLVHLVYMCLKQFKFNLVSCICTSWISLAEISSLITDTTLWSRRDLYKNGVQMFTFLCNMQNFQPFSFYLNLLVFWLFFFSVAFWQFFFVNSLLSVMQSPPSLFAQRPGSFFFFIPTSTFLLLPLFFLMK